MRCNVDVSRSGALVIARSAEFPECIGRGANREQALERLRAEITFWLEGCPCDQTAAPGLVLHVVSDESSG